MRILAFLELILQQEDFSFLGAVKLADLMTESGWMFPISNLINDKGV